MSAYYPDDLYSRGIGGRVLVELIVRPDSAPEAISVARSSGHPELDEATIQVLALSRFEPGYYKGCPVRVLISMPMTWTPPPKEDPTPMAVPRSR